MTKYAWCVMLRLSLMGSASHTYQRPTFKHCKEWVLLICRTGTLRINIPIQQCMLLLAACPPQALKVDSCQHLDDNSIALRFVPWHHLICNASFTLQHQVLRRWAMREFRFWWLELTDQKLVLYADSGSVEQLPCQEGSSLGLIPTRWTRWCQHTCISSKGQENVKVSKYCILALLSTASKLSSFFTLECIPPHKVQGRKKECRLAGGFQQASNL